MKIHPVLALILVLLMVLNIFALLRIVAMDAQIMELENRRSDEYELAEPMGAFQRFADKLYFSGLAENWELAAFYLHEMKETAEEIIAHEIIEDGMEITPLMRGHLLPALNQLRSALESRETPLFERRYQSLVTSCNGCHQATRHEFIQITVPTESMFKNQRFGPR
jgi:hypothetical protein